MGQVSIPYASSEIIVEIIVIAEKCSSGFVLITQVKALFPGLKSGSDPMPSSPRHVPAITRYKFSVGL